MGWEEVLGSRELLRRRLVAISAVHGWEARSGRKTFLGGIAPGALIESLRSEVAELDAAAELASKAEVLLELRQARAALEALSEEREQAADDLAALRDEHFEVCRRVLFSHSAPHPAAKRFVPASPSAASPPPAAGPRPPRAAGRRA